jgi:hypothetical protein
MYEMQGPRPARRCWLTDCSAARHCPTDHCYQIPVQDAGCPTAQPFPGLPPRAVPSPGTRPERRSPGSPAVSRNHPRDRIRSRYPSEALVTRLLSRLRSFLRNRYLQQVPVRDSGRPAPQPFPEFPPESVPIYQVPVRGAGCPAPQPLPEFPPESVPDSRIPVRNSGCPASRPFSEFPPGAVPVFSGDEFLQPPPDPAQGFSRSNFKIF